VQTSGLCFSNMLPGVAEGGRQSILDAIVGADDVILQVFRGLGTVIPDTSLVDEEVSVCQRINHINQINQINHD
jgi:hypothetical protein